MENPHEDVQAALFSRIITNVEKLNESVFELNKRIKSVNRDNMEVELLSQMWSNYIRAANFHLQATETLSEPI